MRGLPTNSLSAPAPPPGPSSTSLQLLLRARRGDREALEELFERLGTTLRRWARGRLPPWARVGSDTADIVQDVLVNAFRRLDRFEPRRKQALQCYLRECIRNRIRDEMRKAGRHPAPDGLDGVEVPVASHLLEDLVDEEQRARFRAGLGRLGEDARDLVVARIELGYSYEQIALATGRPTASAARMAVRRALLRLAEEMSAG
ncbi:MAG TPA: RNA polymerase sigma factor [Vicinamibacteria bacterium]